MPTTAEMLVQAAASMLLMLVFAGLLGYAAAHVFIAPEPTRDRPRRPR